jgi:hypothetical protein
VFGGSDCGGSDCGGSDRDGSDPDGPAPDDPVEAVRRWEWSGGVWRVLADDGDTLTVGLFQCTGGELMQRVVSADPRLRATLGRRLSSED